MVSAPDVEALLREHVHVGFDLTECKWKCACGEAMSNAIEHEKHQAAIITAAYAETLAGVRAEALREAADDMAQFGPFPGEEPDWLRERADRTEGA